MGNIPSPGNVHGFFYFYFINEQVLRFLGKRYPVDYNKLPFFSTGACTWSGSFPGASTCRSFSGKRGPPEPDGRPFGRSAIRLGAALFRGKTNWLLAIYAAVILIFFSLSTNQEYYTYPVYFPLLMLTAGCLARGKRPRASEQVAHWSPGDIRWDRRCGRGRPGVRPVVFTAIPGAAILARFSPIATWLVIRSPCLTSSISPGRPLPRCAYLRRSQPRAASGPVVAWVLRRQRHHFEATASVAFTSAVFLIAAHIALVRFEPMLSSHAMADTINHIPRATPMPRLSCMAM